MNRVLAAMIALALSGLAVTPLGAAPITKTDLAALIAMADASAKSWVEQDQEDPDLDILLAKVQYDESSVADLTAAINAGRKDPLGAYVAVKLLWPILPTRQDVSLAQVIQVQKAPEWATDDLIKKLLPAAKSAEARLGKYLPLPVYTKEQLKVLEIPDYSAQNITEAMVKALEQINKLRAEKLSREKPTIQHDEMAWHIHRITYRMMLQLNDPREDQQILRLIADHENQGNGDFVYLVGLVEQAAATMSADRAKKFYDVLLRMAQVLRWKYQGYDYWAHIVIRPDDNSRPQALQTFTGVILVDACNALADRCKAQKLTPPDEADVRKAQTYVNQWQKSHPQPPNGTPSDAEVLRWLDDQKQKDKKQGKKG